MLKRVLSSRIVIFIVAIGLGFGAADKAGKNKLEIQKEVSQRKIKKINKKLVFLKNKMAREKYEKFESAASVERETRLIEKETKKRRLENKALRAKIKKLNEELLVQALEVKDSLESLASTRTELAETNESRKDLSGRLDLATEEKNGLNTELRKLENEIDEGKKIISDERQSVARCVSNNTDLALIAEELVEQYRNKGFGSVFLEKEPLTGLKKVKLERMVRQYSSEINGKRVAR